MSPLETPDDRLQQAMRLVLLAMLPGLLSLLWFYGWGVLINLILCVTCALAVEAGVARLRGQALQPLLGDGSALVSATLLAVALPPYCPWWLTITATAAGLLFGKHLYGGVGKNPFNPAMLGFALVIVMFPQPMTQWPAHGMALLDALQQVFNPAQVPDAWVQATALDSLRINKSLTIDELFAANPAFGRFGGRGMEWVNLAFLAGGLFLLQRRVFGWHAPVGMLASLFLVSLLCWNGSGSDSNGSPLLHLFSGATMLGYFKDPQKTAETLTEDGFLRTGDKGEQDAEGRLRLTGRLKEIFKTSKGKYVAPAPIENRLAEHGRIEQVCVVGDGLSAPMGLCVLSAVGQQEAAGEARQSLHGSLERLLEEVNQVLDKHERLRQLVVVKDSWAVENGFLTPTLKIKRNVIESTYGPQFQAWSARSEAVLWQD